MMHHGQDLLWPHYSFIPTDVQNPDHFRKTNKYSLPKKSFVGQKSKISAGPEMNNCMQTGKVNVR